MSINENQILLREFFKVFDRFLLPQVLHMRLGHEVFFSLQRDTALPFGIQKIIEGFWRAAFRHQLRVVGDRVGNQVESDPIALFIDEARWKASRCRRHIGRDNIFLHEDPVGVVIDEDHVSAELAGRDLAQDLRCQRFTGRTRILGFDVGIALPERLDEFLELRNQRGAVNVQLALVFGFGNEIILGVAADRSALIEVQTDYEYVTPTATLSELAGKKLAGD